MVSSERRDGAAAGVRYLGIVVGVRFGCSSQTFTFRHRVGVSHAALLPPDGCSPRTAVPGGPYVDPTAHS